MAKKKSRYTDPKPAGPDHPIYQEGVTFYTPLWARPGYEPPEPKEKPEVEMEPPKE